MHLYHTIILVSCLYFQINLAFNVNGREQDLFQKYSRDDKEDVALKDYSSDYKSTFAGTNSLDEEYDIPVSTHDISKRRKRLVVLFPSLLNFWRNTASYVVRKWERTRDSLLQRNERARANWDNLRQTNVNYRSRWREEFRKNVTELTEYKRDNTRNFNRKAWVIPTYREIVE